MSAKTDLNSPYSLFAFERARSCPLPTSKSPDGFQQYQTVEGRRNLQIRLFQRLNEQISFNNRVIEQNLGKPEVAKVIAYTNAMIARRELLNRKLRQLALQG